MNWFIHSSLWTKINWKGRFRGKWNFKGFTTRVLHREGPINAYKMVPAAKQEVLTSCSDLRAAGSDQKPQSCSSGRPGCLLPQPFNSAPTWLHSLAQAHQSQALELSARLSAFAPSFRNQETWRRLFMKRQRTERTLFCPTKYGGPDCGTTLLNILKMFMSHSLKNEVRSGEAFQLKARFHSWNECIRDLIGVAKLYIRPALQ